ncbi:MAG TPA: neutral/alkaline non-lysosomal ceramidase N-terminal domain-containing protein [Thermoanaerobaculia bacterium]|nr:neutral/alkaline non-lysosomal ceramidase N-terminal domain-containing protein [Thermoanaerobaculia bacterium]
MSRASPWSRPRGAGLLSSAPLRVRVLGRVLWTTFGPPLLMALIAVPAFAELRAGSARADLTPPDGSSMYGYGARVGVSTGVHDRLWARALVLEQAPSGGGTTGGARVAIVSLDLGSFSKASTERVRSLVAERQRFEQVLLIASHTHSAPRADESFPDPASPHIREIERRIADAVVEAAGVLRPATLRAGWGELNGCHNRRRVHPDGAVEMLWENRPGLPTSPLDRSVGVIAVQAPDSSAIATLVNFACHPVVLGPENLEISADYPGVMAARLEAELGGVAMFLPGAAGDTNPNWDKTPPAEGGFEQAELLGRRLADEVLRVLGGLEPRSPGASGPGVEGEAGSTAAGSRAEEVELDVRTATIELAPRWDLADPSVREVFAERGQARLFEYYRDRFAAERVAEITTLRLAPDIALAFFPGEFFVEHGLRLKRESLIENTLFVGYANGELGYFPTIRAAAEGGYGADEATLVEVGAGDRLVALALIALLEQSGALGALPPP